jgi:TRAP-type C4-dicarboxylate transport system permease small subunit
MADERSKKGGRVTVWLSQVGNLALTVMMLLTTADVCGRYFFNSPVLGAYEITEYLMLIMIFAYLALAQAEKAHINVDIVFNRLPGKWRSFLERFNHFVCFILMVLVVVMSVRHVFELKKAGDMSTLLKIPDYPFGIFLVIGAAALCIEFFRDAVGSISTREERKKP